MRQFEAKAHRDMPPTAFWGYNASCPGPTIEVRSGEPVLVEWINSLPTRHLFPIDRTLCGAETGNPDVRTVVHLHGAKTGPESDGYPEHWFVPGQSGTCYYPNGQESCSLFYHDHAMGITRLNAAAGLTGLYLIRDQFEDSLNLPRGAYEIPVVLFDRSFHHDGRLYYPVSGQAGDTLGLGVLRQRHSGQRQDLSLPRGGAAQIPFPPAQQLEWQLLPPVDERGALGCGSRHRVPPDWQRAGSARDSGFAHHADPRSRRARRPDRRL
jgi:FtsP/CotA-like multicopper oxidase with cupredoxin domain